MGRLRVLFVGFFFSLPAVSQTYLVLPFANLTDAESLRWVGESTAESLVESLAVENRASISREDREEAFRALGLKRHARWTRATVLKIGMSLDASVVVFGEVQGTASSLKLTAHAIDLKDLRATKEASASGPLEALSAMQTDLSYQLLAASERPAISERDYRARRPLLRVDSLEAFANGIVGRTAEARLQGLSTAARLDPRYTAASYELGKLYLQKKMWPEAALWLAKIPKGAAHFREAQFHLGIARFHLGDYGQAAEAFDSLSQDVPLSEVFNNLGVAQSRSGNSSALATFQKAVEGDGADPTYRFNLGYALMRAARFQDAAKQFHAVLDRTSTDAEATQMLGRCLRPAGPPPPGLERLKNEYRESAYFQLKAILGSSKAP